MALVIAEQGSERLHRQRLRALLKTTTGTVRIASAYVTDRELLREVKNRKVRLVTSLMPMDVASKATNLEALRAFLQSQVECRRFPGPQRLHAKVYVFGNTSAVVTSANLTENALGSNIEVGVEVSGKSVQELIKWYDQLWDTSVPLTLPYLAKLQQETAALSRAYAKLKKKVRQKVSQSTQANTNVFPDDLRQLIDTAKQFFVCNTDRRQRRRTKTGGYALEEAMHDRGYAAAWEDFAYPSHMEQVQAGDAIFMYAKGKGIIGIGCATGPHEVLALNTPGRIRNFANETKTREWRIPVRWLDWRDAADAYPWNAPNFTFWNVSADDYTELREGVREHFLGD